MRTSVLLSVLTSASASLCCIVPFLGIIGSSGSLMASVSWLEPFRPLFVGGTFLFLGFAWFKIMRSPKTDECGCERRASFFQSRKFLSVVTVLSILLISFPSYSKLLMPRQESAGSMVTQEKSKKITLTVSGMTCASCEHHIESEVIKLSGVSSVKASYAGKSTTVVYNPQMTDETKIIAAIDSTGYKVNLPNPKH